MKLTPKQRELLRALQADPARIPGEPGEPKLLMGFYEGLYRELIEAGLVEKIADAEITGFTAEAVRYRPRTLFRLTPKGRRLMDAEE